MRDLQPHKPELQPHLPIIFAYESGVQVRALAAATGALAHASQHNCNMRLASTALCAAHVLP